VLRLVLTIHAIALRTESRLRRRLAGDAGQSTAEYALVLLGAAGVALLLVGWATQTDRIPRLLNGVLDRVLGYVG
jgi:hypothetical protein